MGLCVREGQSELERFDEIQKEHDIHFHGAKQTGSVFHMIGAVAGYGSPDGGVQARTHWTFLRTWPWDRLYRILCSALPMMVTLGER